MVLDESLILSALASFFCKMLIQNGSFSFYSRENERCSGLIKKPCEAWPGPSPGQTLVTYNLNETTPSTVHDHQRDGEGFPNISKHQWIVTMKNIHLIKSHE